MSVFRNLRLLGPDGLRPCDLRLAGGRIAAIAEAGSMAGGEDLRGQILSPPMLDVQVNGGGGLMLGDCHNVDDLRIMAGAHLDDAVPHLLPTLITDTRQEIARIGNLVAKARAEGVWQILGLHLEGPHLTRAGAHDPEKLRPLQQEDFDLYKRIKAQVGHLKLTLAPEMVPPETISALTEAGIIIALGHTNCASATAEAAFQAGAKTATHLFNAMSGLDHRAPGLAAAALEHGTFGLIADGVHVHPAMLRLAMTHARRAYLVSDAMAVAGTDLPGFDLGGRAISRQDGRLALTDGTLAGADLTLQRAVEVMVQKVGVPVAQAIAMATVTPRQLLGLPVELCPGDPALFHIWDGPNPRLHLPGSGVL